MYAARPRRRRPRRLGRRAAFSLIELTAVLALSAILLAAGSEAFAQWRASADMKDAIDRIGSADAVVRREANSAGVPMQLRFDLDTGALLRSAATSDAEPTVIGQLPTSVHIAQVLPEPPDGGQDQLAVTISPAGRSRSYAMLVEGSGGRRQWIAIAGLTGQLVRLSDEQQAQELIETVRPSDDAR